MPVNKLITTKLSIRKYLLLLLFLPIFFVPNSCKKIPVSHPEKNIFIKTDLFPDFIINLDLVIKEVIPLKDNTFWVHYIDAAATELWGQCKLEHYDEHFKLLNEAYFPNHTFGDFIVNGNNDILASAVVTDRTTFNSDIRFIQFDNQLHILHIDSNVANNLVPVKKIFGNNSFTKLSGGKYIHCFGATNHSVTNIKDSNFIYMASYDAPISSSVPNWMNYSGYHDKNLNIYGSRFSTIESDEQNNYYTISRSDPATDFSVIRKHSGNGTLIWQKKLPFYFWSPEMQYTGGKIVLHEKGEAAIYHIDNLGNITIQNLSKVIIRLIGNKINGGYIALGYDANTPRIKSEIIIFDAAFNVVKSRATELAGSGITQLSGGKYLIYGLVEGPLDNEYQLMLYKVNENLEIID